MVATPIGNLEDITLRGLRILKEVDFILCEDTRVTKILLDKYEIKTPTISYFQHSGLAKVKQIIDLLKQGKNLALVSDAGTPGISDPGNKLIELVLADLPNIKIEPIPGANAAISALSISGLPTDKFVFYGFLPHKKGKETILKEIINNKFTSVFYESTHRILKTLNKLKDLGLDKHVVVCRELTKKFETVYRGSISEVLTELEKGITKGEFVVVIG
ncbi:MAG: 16S rRNA (cytidine(1402)-2'-O)-methyltransferase [Candidatus Buchananbacteria bacterium RBG_13_36_9]|uniref:Ribosomal RNA small subunit methyltransferase I n=1 Tax=Candidatus Buchananbacteria bacterium RBG_13_36_9 TaxID=1797530 RepID=A0A1G1XQG5_9BACT|nr:MAG: 16S rRNA (cytidine(1402)-2'-O)-methyltransferase [Candidatus Buchananbacteria bacterium RBG_13_36_9]